MAIPRHPREFTQRTSVDKRNCPIAASIAERCFPEWRGHTIIVVEADAIWCFRPVTGDATSVRLVNLETFVIRDQHTLKREYYAEHGHAVVMTRDQGALWASSDSVVAIIIPALPIDAPEHAVCLDALLEGNTPAAIAVIQASGRDRRMAELLCISLGKYASALNH